jgi:2-hydroxychromene-2-carboxylate isomerase
LGVLQIQRFGDPACPWDFSAEPARYRLRWHYGDALVWRPTMVVLSEHVDEIARRGFTPERAASSLAWFQERFGMPIDATPRLRIAVSVDACRAVVAARLHAPEAEEALLRRLRVRTMAGGLLDDPELIRGAAADAGLDPDDLAAWVREPAVEEALRADKRATRSPSPAAHALDHKLGGPPEERRYTAPSYVISRLDGGGTLTIPGFNGVEAYEAAIANLAPELERRPKPESVAEVLQWAREPLATAEVALLCQLERDEARRELEQVATPIAAGRDFYWTLDVADRRAAA